MNAFNLSMRASALTLVALLTACGGDDDNNNGDVSALETRVDAMEARLMLLDDSSTSLNDSLDAIEARLGTFPDNTSISDELAEITALLDAIEARLYNLENAVASRYEITLINTTSNQPIAPAAILLHDDVYKVWSIGSPASLGLENLAEAGNPSILMDEIDYAFDSAVGSDMPIGPGMRTTVEVEAVWREDLSLTIAAMPVFTNDAFTGTTAWNIASLEEGMTMRALLPVYDAGTEANTELTGDIPGFGPAGGFDAARDDVADMVTRHQGVVTADDGFADSGLDESHRFDQGALYVIVERLSNP